MVIGQNEMLEDSNIFHFIFEDEEMSKIKFQYDGSLDFGRTSSCFQVLREEDTVS